MDSNKQNIFIATAIPYATAKPHIGNAMDYLYGDILARYYRQQGNNVIFSAGADEFGGKIATKAAEANLTPQQFVDSVSLEIANQMAAMGVSHDRFVRTSNPEHVARVQYIWKSLEPYIYKGKYHGYYCTGCESFVTETEAKENNGVCPDHNIKYELLDEENYFFKLSAFGPKLFELISSDELKITPSFRKNEILNTIKDGLQDISISRPKNKINWGVPVPDDEEQVIYIWIDALSNYITILGFPESNDFKNFWPAHTQVLGKGVMRFHAAIWPAMLLGLNLPLPNNLFVHGYVISNNKKMSKTLNNVIYPEDIIQIFGQDAYRYFFFKHISSYDDGNFSWHKMYDSYTTELSNELGNLVSRTINMCSKYGLHLTFDEISQLPNRHDMLQFHESMLEYNFPKALESVWELVRGANKFIESTKPWQIAKDPADQDHLKDILISLVTDLKQIAFYLEPFTPNCANQINYVLRNYNNDEFLIPQLFPKIELPGELSIS